MQTNTPSGMLGAPPRRARRAKEFRDAGVKVNLLGIPLADRPQFFANLLPNLQATRTHDCGP